MESSTANQSRDSYIRNCLDELYKLWLRRLLLITSILNAVFFPYDMLYSVERLIPFMGTRFAVSLYLLLLWWVAGKRREAGLGFHRIIYFAFILGYMIPLEVRILMSGALASPYYSAVLFLILLAIGFIPERIYILLLTAFTIQSIYLVPILLISGTNPANLIIENNTRILFLVAFLVFIRYLYSKRLFTEVGLRYDLMEHKGNLEQLVNERTEELMRVNRDLEEEIHEKKKMEATLQKSENKYRTLAENISDVIWTRNLDLRLTYISTSVLKQQGYTVEEAMALPLEGLLTPESYKIAASTLKEQLAMEQAGHTDINRTATLELEIVHKDGSTIPVELNMSFIRDDKGRPVEILGTTRDISERNRAENALRESEEKYRQLFENMIYGYAYHRIIMNEAGLPIDYTFLEVNKAFEDVLGMTRDQLIGKRVTKVLPGIEDSEFDWIKVYGEVALTGESVNFEQFFEPLDKWFAIHAFSHEKEYFSVIFEDITERKQAQDAILRSEQRYRSLFENASDAIYIIEPETQRIVDINKSASRILGYSREEFIGMSINDISSVESTSDNPARIADLKMKGSLVFEDVHVHKSGKEIPVEINTSSVMWEEGTPVIMAFVRDISERKQAEEALKASEDKFSKVFYSSPDSITVSTLKDGIFVDVNEGFLNMSGFSREEIIGKSSIELDIWLNPKSRAELADILKNKGRIRDFETKIRIKSGELRTILLSAEIIELYKEPHMVAIARDITERKIMESALLESEGHLREFAEMLPELVFEVDREGKFTFVNENTLRITGYDKDELIGRSPFDFLIAPEQKKKAIKDLEDSLSGEVIAGAENIIISKDGIRIPILVYSAPIIKGDKVVGVRGIAVDITERLKAEEERKAHERKILEASEQERRRIGYDLHDGAGQLLTGTAFIAKVLEQQLQKKGMLDESGETAEIVGNINKAIDMIRRLSMGLYPVELEASGLYVAFKDLTESAESYYDIKCDLKFNKRIRIPDKSVATQLYLIAREAVNNAAKHSKAKSIKIFFIKSGNAIKLEVLDDGVGVPEQLDESKGLGFQTMRYRAGLIGAILSIRSTPKGTRVKCEYSE